jgi:hypothetical protein
MIHFNAQAAGAQIKGLRILDVSALDLPGRGTEFFELGRFHSTGSFKLHHLLFHSSNIN